METTGATTDTPFPLLATQPTETMPPYWTYSEGFNRYLNFNFCFDLDNGEDSDTAKPGCDFFIYRGAGSLYDQIEYVPSPPAMVTFWNSFDDPPGFSDCRRAPAYTSQVTTIAPLELGYLCYQTGGGRFGYLRFINASADVVTIDWHTFDPPLAQIQASSLPVNPATSDLKPPAGQPVWQDSFDDDNNWTIYQDEHASFTIEEGYLTITVRRADSRESRLLTWQRMSDFYLEATFKAENCSGLNNYGLHVRAGKDEAEADGYMFSVSCNGLYSLRRRSGSVTKILIPWTQVPDFLPSASQAHRPGILAQGDHLALFLDGSLLGDIKDDTFSSGVFGPFISAVETPGYRVDVDQIAAWALK